MSATRTPSTLKPPAPMQGPFCLLAENRFASTATQMLAHLDDDFAPWLVYLHGPSGCGKTHLARQFERNFSTSHPDEIVRNLPCHEFIQDLHEAFSRGTILGYREEFSAGDAIIIEDVHSIERSPKAQEILQWGLDRFYEQGARVLVTARKTPGDLVGVLPKLRHRFRSGIVAGVEMPSQESRRILLTHFALQSGMTLSESIIDTLAEMSSGSPRELDALLKQLKRTVQSERATLNEAFVKRFLIQERDQFEPTLSQIANCVASQFGVTVKAMRSRDRNQKIAGPRQAAIWLTRQLTDLPLKRIGEFYKLTNHTTVMHAVKIVEQRRQETPAFDHELHRLKQKIAGLPVKAR